MSVPGDEGLTVSYSSGEGDARLTRLVSEAVKSAVEGEDRRLDEISVVLTTDDLLRRLNRDYLEIDEPTDVLAFDLGDETSAGELIEGEIYVSLDRARAQAGERGVEFEFELLQIVVHGLLHLCGHDHQDDASLLRMNNRGEEYVRSVLERELVGR